MTRIVQNILLRYAGVEENAIMKLLHEVSTNIGVAEHSYVVGGAVRDVAMGIDPKDVDVVVETKNGKDAYTLGSAIAEYLGIPPSNVIADQYGVVHVGPVPHDFMYDGVNLLGQKIEIVTARKEYYERGKGQDWKPSKVEPGTIEDDLNRRDFTLNTLVFQLSQLASGPDKDLIADILGKGRSDLTNKILRTPINPSETFQEDPTRLLRAVRMVVKYGLKFDVETARALRQNAHHVSRIPEEKISEELSKLIKGKNPKYAIKLLDAMGILQHVIPELKALKMDKHTDGTRHTLEQVLNAVDNLDNDLVSRMTALFSELDRPAIREMSWQEADFYSENNVTPEIAEKIMRRLRYPNEIIKQVVTLLKATETFEEELTDKDLRRLKYELGEHLETLLNIIHAKNLAQAAQHVNRNQVPKLRQRYLEMSEAEGFKYLDRLAKPPVNGKDLMQLLGLKRGGPIVGQAMNYQKDLILEYPEISNVALKFKIKERFGQELA